MLTVTQLEAHRVQLIAYLTMKLEAEDFHGVQDAASDLRELDAQLATHRAYARGDADS